MLLTDLSMLISQQVSLVYTAGLFNSSPSGALACQDPTILISRFSEILNLKRMVPSGR